MFFDWLSCYQDFDFELPVISDDGYCYYDFIENELGEIRQNKVTHEGSYSTSIQVHVKGNRLYMSGNPSRYNRIENLFGFETLEQCFAVYNRICDDLGLPHFTRCKTHGFRPESRPNGSIHFVPVIKGAIITTLHITQNIAVGSDSCLNTYLKALSTLPYRRSRGRLHTDGKTVDWLSIQGNARYQYPSVYDKAHELKLHSLPKIKKNFGKHSEEYYYLEQLIAYCKNKGVARFELKLNSPFLKKHHFCYYGLFETTLLNNLLTDFIHIDDKLTVSAMNITTITQELLTQGICTNTRSANTTALYAINWMNGQVFDNFKHNNQTRLYRSRLRKLGIDIAKPCNLLTFSPVIVKEVIEIKKTELQPPPFYKFPETMHLRAVKSA